MVVVVRAAEQAPVEALAGRIKQAFPDRVALFGRSEGEESEGGVAKSILVGLIVEGLGRKAPGGEVDQVGAVKLGI